MTRPDLNQLITLDVLLAEGSVARAAKRLRLSPSAMSRALARLRDTLGDPLLVRAGRGLVPTPRALELRERTARLVEDAQGLLRPADVLNLKGLSRSFTLRTSDGFVETFGPELIRRVAESAPGVRLRFVQKPDRDSGPLRDGSVDMETGVVGAVIGPEIRAQALFRDHFVAVVRRDHPISDMTAAAYSAGRHVGVARRGPDKGPIDDALAPLGIERDLAVLAGGYSAVLALVSSSDLIATVPQRHTEGLRHGMTTFSLPFAVAGVTVSLLWHPRLDADPAHRWLRDCVRAVCGHRAHGLPDDPEGS
ncbi:bacterial regulatory helix-turn-helix protein, lysR family protein [Asticcacaulis biprosthecium C19]|uniref:Bacterial regulatory helix-turn-helix protein, lysR family protein n=1 Tax=Asticcacaulis biprosthecium C19 TaxID=715226 RepID=F4QIA8_9CAUL|nr:LysR family transcriptional regulator [Asticcacaulis biprosthecium]EGF91746.1 bacterial regulatory helix-turn-helix protein, lysR family protein [Asticcacaulis biprosthecium C19]